ncbi:MAG: M14 family zinc carboxypeptidase [Candidatus Odinarchaeota archaeon]
MSYKRLASLFMLIFLPSLVLPLYTQEVSATLVLKEPNRPDVQRTWGTVSLRYDNQYHNTSTLWEEIDIFSEIASDLVDVDIIGSSYFGRDIKAVRITNELDPRQKAKTLVVSNHHGRELISVEVALRFIQHVLDSYGVDGLITDAVNTQEIYIIPTINPDALDRVVNDQDHWLRKNTRPFDDDGDGKFDEDPYEDVNGDGCVSGYFVYEKSGADLNQLYYYQEGVDNDGDGLINEDMVGYVDLNRNYPTFFRDGTGWSDDSLAGNYPGDESFSEPEVQTYRDFAEDHRFAMAYSLHSGTNATYLLRNSAGYIESDLCELMIEDFRDMVPSSFYFNDLFFGDPNNPDYPAGVWDHWMYADRKTLVPISLELYGNLTASTAEIPIMENSTHLITEWKEIFNFYNPDEGYINDIWEGVRPYFPYLLENTPRLKVDGTLHSKDDRPGAQVNISFTCSNLSPKLPTVSTVDVFDETGTKIYDGKEVLANSVARIDAIFPLPSVFTDSYEIKVGNEYVGYHSFALKFEEETTTFQGFQSRFSIVGTIIAISVMSLLLRKKKK